MSKPGADPYPVYMLYIIMFFPGTPGRLFSFVQKCLPIFDHGNRP